VVALVLLAITSVAIYFFIHRPESGVDPTRAQREADLQNESQALRKQRRLEEAIAKDREIESLKGALAPWARNDAETLGKLVQQENSLMAEAKTPDDKNEYQRAEQLYQQVIDLHGAREMEALAARDAVILREKGGSLATMAQGFFDHGTDAFKRRDYSAAERFFQNALKQAPQDWAPRAQAQNFVAKCENRLRQQSALREAQAQFGAKQYEPARNSVSQAVNAQDGDPEFQRQAQALLQQIQAREDQQRAFNEGTRLENAGKVGPAKAEYEHAVNVSSGDPEISARAKEGLKRIETAPPPPPPKNYDAQIRDIRTLIGQGRWDEVDPKLSTLPTTLPEYSQFKRQLADGRQEDQDFNTRKSAVSKAVLEKNESALKDLFKFFSLVANQGARHGAEANDIATRIDRTLKEIASANSSGGKSGSGSTGGVSSGKSGAAAIKEVLEAYARALDSGDLNGLRAVRQLRPGEEKKVVEALKATKGKGYVLDCSPAEISGDTATVGCDTALTRVSTARSHTNLFLNRINGHWIIVSTN
jgi:tetratricopeptide (TPR) repeat protein